MKVAFLCFGEDDVFDFTKSFDYIKAYLSEQYRSDSEYHYPWNLLSEIMNTTGYIGQQDGAPVFQIFVYLPDCGRDISDEEIKSETLNHYRERSYLIDNVVQSEVTQYRVIIQDINVIEELDKLIEEWCHVDNSN